MSFSDLAWEERTPGHRVRQRHSYQEFESFSERSNSLANLPDWTELNTPSRVRKSRVGFFDVLTIIGYLLVAVFLTASVVVEVSSGSQSWIFLKVVAAVMALFLTTGRLIEMRWRGQYDR
jgi:hypothetical protein